MPCCVSLLYQICKKVKHSIEFLVRCIISSWILHANNVLTLIYYCAQNLMNSHLLHMYYEGISKNFNLLKISNEFDGIREFN